MHFSKQGYIRKYELIMRGPSTTPDSTASRTRTTMRSPRHRRPLRATVAAIRGKLLSNATCKQITHTHTLLQKFRIMQHTLLFVLDK